jgi:phosphoribosylformimino-5-aminoimidazole carboxamide ribotide isomerase
MKFRPCIDLHNGEVKQIVGSTLTEDKQVSLTTNFVSEMPSSYYAKMYKDDKLTGGHVIMLGPGCDNAAREALQAYPRGLQIGGGINSKNAKEWLETGASHIIITSYVFRDGIVDEKRLAALAEQVGKERLVLDLSCRKKNGHYYIVTDRWQKFTKVKISEQSLNFFAEFCTEFLIHAVDVEGKCNGVDQELTENLANWSPIPTTYAGGVKNIEDMHIIKKIGRQHLDATIGSALDIFGGNGITYKQAVAFHRDNNQ